MTCPILPEHRRFLRYLSTDTVALGECYSALSLWRLIGEGYVTIEPVNDDRSWVYARVILTEKGIAEALK